MITQFRVTVLAALLLASAAQLSATVVRDEGGLTFPVVADFTDNDGTEYATEIRLATTNRVSVYPRFEWMSIDGESFEYLDVHNPINGTAGYRPLKYIALWRGESVTTVGALRIVPCDINNNPVKGIQISGDGRVYVQRADGASSTEHIDGVPDREIFFIGPKKDVGFIARHPFGPDMHVFFITNLSSTEHTYAASLGTNYVNGFDIKSWKWEGSIKVKPNRTAMLFVSEVPKEVYDSRSFDGQNVFRAFSGGIGCQDCASDGGAYTAMFVNINQKSGDVRVDDTLKAN